MGIDRIDDEPVVEATLEQPADGDPARHDAAIAYETRDPATYYQELQAAVAAEREESNDRAAVEWDAAAQRFSDMWAEHTQKWPRDTRPDGSDADTTWRGAGGRHLDSDANDSVDRGCERIREIEENVITPAILRIEAKDSTRKLVGFDHRLKGPDRIKEKVADQIAAQPGLTADRAMEVVKDSVRYTFQYPQEKYAIGVQDDSMRLKQEGFDLVELRNTWAREEYKAINSRWRDLKSGQLFEVQFHTQTSFEAKQLTHAAYERLRDPETSRDEQRDLRDYQCEVSASVQIPIGALEILDVPGRTNDP